jgi:hypothetical protein
MQILITAKNTICVRKLPIVKLCNSTSAFLMTADAFLWVQLNMNWGKRGEYRDLINRANFYG